MKPDFALVLQINLHGFFIEKHPDPSTLPEAAVCRSVSHELTAITHVIALEDKEP
jgi:hypothetical protein